MTGDMLGNEAQHGLILIFGHSRGRQSRLILDF
jgi:hypothetical protein